MLYSVHEGHKKRKTSNSIRPLGEKNSHSYYSLLLLLLSMALLLLLLVVFYSNR